MAESTRRSRFAPLVLLVLALLLATAIYAVISSSAHADTTAGDASDITKGEKLFQANCSTCHGAQAEGTDIGPSLIGVGAASVHFQVSTGRMPMAALVTQAPAKPVVFDEEQTAQLSAFVASLGAGPAIPTAEMVNPELGDPANGMLLYRTNCAMCHNAIGAGGALSAGKWAPPLFETTPTQMYEAMLTGPQAMPVFNEASITSEGKRDVIAFLMEQREVPPGGTTLGSLGPVGEGLWVWIIGMGTLVGIAVWVGAKSS